MRQAYKVLTIWLLLAAIGYGAAGYRTANFTVTAHTPKFAQTCAERAEFWRVEMARLWLGKEMPPWSKPCNVTARVTNGAGGAASFIFDRGQVFGFVMKVQGSEKLILDAVLPHEVSHTVFASHFRKPLPRWLDEGACTTVEYPTEVARQERSLITYLKTGRGIPFDQMLTLKQYPADVTPLYSQGHSVCQWLIEKYDRATLMKFIANGLADDNWPRAVREVYGYESPMDMQTDWNNWVKAGRPPVGWKAVKVIAEKKVCRWNGYEWVCGDDGTGDQPATFLRDPEDRLTPIDPPAVAQNPAKTPAHTGGCKCGCVERWAALEKWQATYADGLEASLKIRDEKIAKLEANGGKPGDKGDQGPPGPAVTAQQLTEIEKNLWVKIKQQIKPPASEPVADDPQVHYYDLRPHKEK